MTDDEIQATGAAVLRRIEHASSLNKQARALIDRASVHRFRYFTNQRLLCRARLLGDAIDALIAENASDLRRIQRR